MTALVDIRFEQSEFGGGWAIPVTTRGTEGAEALTGEAPSPIAPLGGARGYIVEPQDAGDWLDMAIERDLVLRLPCGAVVRRPKTN